MAYHFHENRKLYFEHQRLTTHNYIIPFIEDKFKIAQGLHVLEIGCGEAGVLKAFLEKGCTAVGVDLSASKLQLAESMMKEEIDSSSITFINKDIYEEEFKEEFKNCFDIIILKDVIEHIHDQEKLISYLHTFLKNDGIVFFAFPPWQMPFGGHQQMCNSKLSRMPYIHLLPKKIYQRLLKIFGEPETRLEGLPNMKNTSMTIEKFQRIVKQQNFSVLNKKHFLINPIYEYKFNLKPKEQINLIKTIPYLRNFFTTAVYYLVKPV